MNKLKPLLITILLISSVVLIIWIAYSMGKKSNNNQEKALPSPTQTPTTITPTPTASNSGYIEGSLGFPSEGIPEAMIVCAENIDSNQTTCSNDQLKSSKYTYGLGYKIEVPIGNYHVYAYVPGFNQDYKAYYSEFVTCGLSVDCVSHNPIVIQVSAGSTQENVDPQDWYAQ